MMTSHPTRFAVRYREPGHRTDILEPVTTPIDGAAAIKELAVHRAIVGTLVEVTYTPVHPEITEQARREAVEAVVADWLDEGSDERSSCLWLARLTSGTYADQLTDDLRDIPNACRRTWWLDKAALHLERLLAEFHGSTEFDRDEDAHLFGHAVAVLSGVEPHDVDGRVCTRCYAATPSKTNAGAAA